MTWGQLEFWVWPYLCWGTASLKFKQLESAVCGALGLFCLGMSLYGVTLLGVYRGVWVPNFVGLDA